VAPPTITIAKTKPATAKSQTATARERFAETMFSRASGARA
jgi:hypothetical protein